MTVLLLNASYEPLTVIPMRRAISLMLRDRVMSASEDALIMRGESYEFEIPRVLRLRKYVNVPRRGVRWSRRAVFNRDQYTCIYCGIQPGEGRKGKVVTRNDFTLDHVVPKSRGGKNTWGNTACACAKCNHRKDARLPHEAGMKLLWEPKRPRVDYLVAAGDVPDSWKVYLAV